MLNRELKFELSRDKVMVTDLGGNCAERKLYDGRPTHTDDAHITHAAAPPAWLRENDPVLL